MPAFTAVLPPFAELLSPERRFPVAWAPRVCVGYNRENSATTPPTTVSLLTLVGTELVPTSSTCHGGAGVNEQGHTRHSSNRSDTDNPDTEQHSNKRALLQQLTIDQTATTTPASSNSAFALSLAALVGAVVGGLAIWTLVPEPAPATSATASIIDQPTPAPRAPIIGTAVLNASGYITARRVATVSSEVMGRIVSVDVEEGMAVTQNQILAQLDDRVARVNLALAEAQVVAQRERINSYVTDLEEARRVLKRLTRLDESQFTSEAQVTRAKADRDKLAAALASSRAELKVAELNVERLQQDLNHHTIRAPFGGVITVKNAQPGEIIAPAAAGGGFTRTGICTLVDMNSLEVEVDVNVAFIGRVFSRQRVIANLDAYPDWDIPATVVAIIPTADRAKATVAVRIALRVDDPRILPNMGVKVAFFAEDVAHAS